MYGILYGQCAPDRCVVLVGWEADDEAQDGEAFVTRVLFWQEGGAKKKLHEQQHPEKPQEQQPEQQQQLEQQPAAACNTPPLTIGHQPNVDKAHQPPFMGQQPTNLQQLTSMQQAFPGAAAAAAAATAAASAATTLAAGITGPQAVPIVLAPAQNTSMPANGSGIGGQPQNHTLPLEPIYRGEESHKDGLTNCHVEGEREIYGVNTELTNPLCADEVSLLRGVVGAVRSLDPDIIVGWDLQRESVGYLVDRHESAISRIS
eukprot:scaffold41727_cov20-Tisochrysis_lutea.AAC.1